MVSFEFLDRKSVNLDQLPSAKTWESTDETYKDQQEWTEMEIQPERIGEAANQIDHLKQHNYKHEGQQLQKDDNADTDTNADADADDEDEDEDEDDYDDDDDDDDDEDEDEDEDEEGEDEGEDEGDHVDSSMILNKPIFSGQVVRL